uniref:EF-hand domain-containing protein n=1 Tax=Eutreptiella gymnastica TaxID=73025 RepID=A0A7S4LKQ9_9EUGL
MDKDSDGVFTVQEFMGSEYALLMTKPFEAQAMAKKREEGLRAAFAAIDTDGSGHLDKAELRSVIRRIHPNHPDRTVNKYTDLAFMELDTNKSGDIQMEEFVRSEYANLFVAMQDAESGPMSRGSIVSEASKRSRQSYTLDIEKEEADHDQFLQQFLSGEPPHTPAHLHSPKHEEGEMIWHNKSEAKHVFLTTVAMDRPTAGKPRFLGVLETERRYTQLTTVFDRWDNTLEGDGIIEHEELARVLQRFFQWSGEETEWRLKAFLAENPLDTKDQDASSAIKLDWPQFVAMVTNLTTQCSAREFDLVCKFLLEAIGDVSAEVESQRRERLVDKLFDFWDFEGTGAIEFSNVVLVFQQYHSMAADNPSVQWVKVQIDKADQNRDGKIQRDEFPTLMKDLLQDLSPHSFDFVYYRLCRAVEHVQFTREASKFQIRQRRLIEHRLANKDLEALMRNSSAPVPILLHGTKFDPSRAVERMAKQAQNKIEPCLISHVKGGQYALQTMKKRGFQNGWWMYMVIDPAFENMDWFLRQVGVEMQTATGRIAPSFRLLILAPFEQINHLPPVLMVNATTLDIDQVALEDMSRAPSDVMADARGRSSLAPSSARSSTTAGSRQPTVLFMDQPLVLGI